jgi:ribonuclease BN (tRNA processing enzyme)
MISTFAPRCSSSRGTTALAPAPISFLRATSRKGSRPLQSYRCQHVEACSRCGNAAADQDGANYQVARLARIEGRSRGYEDLILLNESGRVAESTGACVLMVRAGRAHTPPASEGALESITLDVFPELGASLGIDFVRRPIERSELYIADELGLTCTLAEITRSDRSTTGRHLKKPRCCRFSRNATATPSRVWSTTLPSNWQWCLPPEGRPAFATSVLEAMNGILLGSGGWIPTTKRETCCAFLREGSHALLIDAGTGVHRLVERPDLLTGVGRLDIVLTHFHLDHIVGLSYLPALSLPRPPTTWGPGQLLAGTSTRSILERLLSPPIFSAPLRTIASDVLEIPKGRGFDVGPFSVSTRVQERHAGSTVALRIGDVLTYCTDTAPDPGNVGFASGRRVLLHEAWYAQESSDYGNHSAGGDAGRVAREAGVDHLVLIHINPLQASDEALAASAARAFPSVRDGVDLEALP